MTVSNKHDRRFNTRFVLDDRALYAQLRGFDVDQETLDGVGEWVESGCRYGSGAYNGRYMLETRQFDIMLGGCAEEDKKAISFNF